MGDFEDVFGAGADAVDIIEGYSRQYLRASQSERDNWFGQSASKRSQPKDDREEWRISMRSKGYVQGPSFSNYQEMSAWEKTNTRPHIRMSFEVFFTDGGPSTKLDSSAKYEDDIPF